MASGTDYQFPPGSWSLSDSSRVRDPSFSAYLNDADGEIGVFTADKYFSEGMEGGQKPKERVKVVESGVRRSVAERGNGDAVAFSPVRSKISSGASSIRSESGWHSQSALLHSFPSQVPGRRSIGEKQGKKSVLSSISCRCSCASRKSLKVDEHCRKSAASRESIRADQLLQVRASPAQIPWMKDSKMLNPLMTPSRVDKAGGSPFFSVAGNPSPKLQKGVREGSPYTTSSFDLPAMEKMRKSMSIERKKDILKLNEPNPISAEEYIPSAISVEYYTDDAESDASSDLFEIDSFTGHRKPSFSSQIPDSSASGYDTPTTCCAPSEASIDWSVVTASAADFSVLSDCEEFKPALSVTSTRNNRDTKKEKHRRGNEKANHSLMGCTNHKAVRVATNADPQKTKEYVTSHKRIPKDQFLAVSRFLAQADGHPR
uniref:Uncharacterized protein n=1 Tax=Kalanchoe fedtschenkoi TaxID=63787 RepID=A0A7N0V6D4_KALFE